MPPTALRQSPSLLRSLRWALCCSLRRFPRSLRCQHARLSFRKVIGAVWVPGLGSALGSVGFGAVTTFVALLFAAQGGPTDGWPTRHTPSLSFWRGYSSAIWRTRSAERRSRWSSHWSRPPAKPCSGWPSGPRWPWRGRRSPASASRWSTLALASKRSVASRRRVVAWRWEPTPPFSIWPRGSRVRRLGLIASGATLNVVFLASAATVLCAALVASWLMAHPATAEGYPE